MIYRHTERTFRGLPLTAEQQSVIRHYQHQRQRLGKPWNTPELDEMIEDMLQPPGVDDDGESEVTAQSSAIAERAAGFIDQDMEPVEAFEEWQAAMESEAMKGDKR